MTVHNYLCLTFCLVLKQKSPLWKYPFLYPFVSRDIRHIPQGLKAFYFFQSKIVPIERFHVRYIYFVTSMISNFKLFFILLKTTLQVVLELETSSSGVPRYDCATSAGLSLSISIGTIYLFCLFHPVHEILGRFTLRSWTLESVGSND